MKRSSIKDIARMAGVSVATVSYVLNRKEGVRISDETRKKIFEIAETINYKPNKIARSLKTSQSKLIGLIVADISNDFYSGIARKIEDKALQLGYTLIIGSCDENAEKFCKLTELFSQQQVDGMIVAPVIGSEDVMKRLMQERYPVVCIDRYLPEIPVPCVTVNNREISESVTRLLAEKKFEQIIYTGYKTELAHLREREEGFDTVMNQYPEIRSKKILVGLDNIREEVCRGLEENIGKQPESTVLYFSSNKLALAGLSFLTQNQIQVPRQVSVVAFDQTDAYHLFPAEISYIEQPLEEMADEAVQMLDSQIQQYSERGKKIVLPTSLQLKNSIQ